MIRELEDGPRGIYCGVEDAAHLGRQCLRHR